MYACVAECAGGKIRGGFPYGVGPVADVVEAHLDEPTLGCMADVLDEVGHACLLVGQGACVLYGPCWVRRDVGAARGSKWVLIGGVVQRVNGHGVTLEIGAADERIYRKLDGELVLDVTLVLHALQV